MKGRIIRSLVIVAVLLLAGGAWAQAHAPSVNVGFRFVAAGKPMNAGTYSVDVAGNGSVVLTAAEGGAAVEIPQTKELSDRSFQKPELVFDVVGSLASVRRMGRAQTEEITQEAERRGRILGVPSFTSRRTNRRTRLQCRVPFLWTSSLLRGTIVAEASR